jgi:hypothetical protein
MHLRSLPADWGRPPCSFNPIGGLMRAGDTFLYGGVRDADMGLILFTWFMSGLVGLISRNGGAMGLGRRFGNYATTARSAQVTIPAERWRLALS